MEHRAGANSRIVAKLETRYGASAGVLVVAQKIENGDLRGELLDGALRLIADTNTLEGLEETLLALAEAELDGNLLSTLYYLFQNITLNDTLKFAEVAKGKKHAPSTLSAIRNTTQITGIDSAVETLARCLNIGAGAHYLHALHRALGRHPDGKLTIEEIERSLSANSVPAGWR